MIIMKQNPVEKARCLPETMQKKVESFSGGPGDPNKAHAKNQCCKYTRHTTRPESS